MVFRDYDEEKLQAASLSLVNQIKDVRFEGKKSEKSSYDVFISYSHRNLAQAKLMLKQLNKINPDLKIFFDYEELQTGKFIFTWFHHLLCYQYKSSAPI